MVLSDPHVNLINCTLAEALQSIEQDIAQVRNQEHRQYTLSPDIIPIQPCPEEEHPVGPLSVDEGGPHQRPPVLHIHIPSHNKEVALIPDQSRGQEDVG